MNKYNLNYEALGFNSEQELEESIARVEKMEQLTEEELKNQQEQNLRAGGLNLASLKEDAKREQRDRKVQEAIGDYHWTVKKEQERKERQEAMNELGKMFQAEKEKEAQRELAELNRSTQLENEQKVMEKYGLTNSKERSINEALLSTLNGETGNIYDDWK